MTTSPATGEDAETTLITAPDMSLTAGEQLLQHVKASAVAAGVRLAATVVDRGGNTVASMRMDGAQLGAASLATDKAITAVSFGFATSAWVTSSAPGGSDWGLGGTLGGRAIVFPGGLPAFSGASLVGGLGVSGASSMVDEQCAGLALEANGFTSSAA